MNIAGAPRNAPHKPTATIATAWSSPNNGWAKPPPKPPITLPVWASAGDAKHANATAMAIERKWCPRHAQA
jgi:hypothetical protein